MFTVCDKRGDINRVTVAPGDVDLWHSSGDAVAFLLASLLGLRCSPGHSAGVCQWNVGVLKGRRRSAHLTLIADGELKLAFAGHTMLLVDVLEMDADQWVMDKDSLIHLVDQPRDGGGDAESAAQRRQRLIRRIAELRAKDTKAFLKVVAAEEDISIQRVKQILGRPSRESGSGPRK